MIHGEVSEDFYDTVSFSLASRHGDVSASSDLNILQTNGHEVCNCIAKGMPVNADVCDRVISIRNQ